MFHKLLPLTNYRYININPTGMLMLYMLLVLAEMSYKKLEHHIFANHSLEVMTSEIEPFLFACYNK